MHIGPNPGNDEAMDILLGGVLLVLGLICWAGQVINWLWPETAIRIALTEPEAEVEPVFWVDTRAEAVERLRTLRIAPRCDHRCPR